MGGPERDTHSGRMTTGHEWNGITELDTPVPKTVWFFYIASALCAVFLWVLYPAWPTGKDYTKGILGADQQASVERDLAVVQLRRSEWMQRIAVSDFKSLQADPEIMRNVRSSGGRLFADNCALCHGADGKGMKGYPNLTDKQWLWGGDTATIMETLRVGINSESPETRLTLMQAYGRDDILTQDQIRDVVQHVRSLSGLEKNTSGNGAQIFADQCTSCHGADGKGMQTVGAPNLTDANWIYGGDKKSVLQTLNEGRRGVMPHWEQRLTETERKLLTLYILDLGGQSE